MSSDRMCLVAVPEAARAVASVPGPHCSACRGIKGSTRTARTFLLPALLLLVWQVPEFLLALICLPLFLQNICYIKSVQHQVGRRAMDSQASLILPCSPTGMGMLSSPQCWLSSHHKKAGNTAPFGQIQSKFSTVLLVWDLPAAAFKGL